MSRFIDLFCFILMFVFIWGSAYFTGLMIRAIPDSFHENTIWHNTSDSGEDR